MEFEWDAAKAAINLVKHAIDFEIVRLIWRGEVIDPFDERDVAGERRITALGIVEGDEIIVAIVYPWRKNVRRLISARRARRYERQDYQAKFGRGR